MYYIVDSFGNVHGEATTYQKADALMFDLFTDEEVEVNELEIIEG